MVNVFCNRTWSIICYNITITFKMQKQKYNFKGLQACIGKNKEERDLAEG